LFANLNRREADTTGSSGNNDRLAGLQTGNVDQRAEAVKYCIQAAAASTTKAKRMVSHGICRGVRKFSVKPVSVHRKARNDADRITDFEALNARPNRDNGSGCLVPSRAEAWELRYTDRYETWASARLSPNA